ncbi:MAG: ABC transporter ATP-binding protein, partial [Bacteroidetes bacterium]|nr:ABC transporter ATP-binding protein [Bacteroidota bacterium]
EIADFPGNYTQYRIKENETKETATAPKEQDKNTVSTEVEGEKLSYEERKLFNRLEKEIEKLELKKEALHTKMASCVNDYEKLNELSQESKNIEEQIDEKTMEWLELSERA